MRKRKKSFECANCHHTFNDVNNYCPSCGQENHTHKIPVNHFALELAESLTHFDTKVFKTFRDMVVKPGLVIKNYNSNKRARYVPPVRIYVFLSFIFFFLISILYTGSAEKRSIEMENDVRKSFLENNLDGVGSVNFITKTQISTKDFIDISSIKPLTNFIIDSFLTSRNVKTDWINTRIIHTIIKVYNGETSFKSIYIKMIKFSSYALIIFMPFFAMILKLLYRKKRMFFSEFLVFSIYFHSFIFVLLTIFLILNKYLLHNWDFILAIIFVALIYLIVSLKTVYEDGYLKTFFKWLIISLVYVCSLVFLLFGLFLSSII
jgi:hypothetical protein